MDIKQKLWIRFCIRENLSITVETKVGWDVITWEVSKRCTSVQNMRPLVS